MSSVWRVRPSVAVAAAAAAVAALLVPAAGCMPRFDFTRYTSNQQIYDASREALNNGRAAVAVLGFERLRDVIGSRDSLRPLVIFHLGLAYSRNKVPLKAAGELRQMHALFSTDTLADDALLLAAREYRKLWPHYELDPEYGTAARQVLAVLLTSYPDTPLREEVFREDKELEEMFATKLYEVGMDLFRDRMFPSANEYFDFVIEDYPATEKAREARLAKVRSFQRLGWDDSAAEECVVLRQIHPDDARVRNLCRVGSPGR
jgi:outer membrane protein assembly factor BamD (BamD/ComL family)